MMFISQGLEKGDQSIICRSTVLKGTVVYFGSQFWTANWAAMSYVRDARRILLSLARRSKAPRP